VLEIYPELATACFSLGDIYFNKGKFYFGFNETVLSPESERGTNAWRIKYEVSSG